MGYQTYDKAQFDQLIDALLAIANGLGSVASSLDNIADSIIEASDDGGKQPQ